MNNAMNQMGSVSNITQIPNPNIYNQNIGQMGIGYNQQSSSNIQFPSSNISQFNEQGISSLPL